MSLPRTSRSFLGDSATLTMSVLTLNMTQEPRGWRVDLIKSMGLDDQMIKYAVPIFSAMGNACNDVAGEIDAGTYADSAEAISAIQARTASALTEEMRKVAMKELRSHFWLP